MDKKQAFLRILTLLQDRPVHFLCTATTELRMLGVITEAQELEFIRWVRGMLGNDHYTVISWLRENHYEVYAGMDCEAYRKAWIKHLINYLESLP